MSQSLEERVAELEPLLPRVAELEKALEQQQGTRVTNPLSEDADDTTAPASASQLAASVRSIVARLTETPTNFHQATVHFLATDAAEDAGMKRRTPLLFACSLAMVLMQCLVAVGVMVGTATSSCTSSDQCDAGTWCSVGGQDRCNFCGQADVMPRKDQTTNLTAIAQVCTMPYSGARAWGKTVPNTTVASFCEACVRNDGTIDPLTGPSLIAANLAAMGAFDDVALVFASFIVAFIVVGELKDIELCSIAVTHAGEKLSAGWRLALRFVLWMRRWVFLPALVSDVPILVIIKGGDALSVCLNTVAILFLCDIDNIAFDLALGERVRARVEDAGRVELDDAEAATLARTKAVHVLLLVLAMLVGAQSGQIGSAIMIVFPAFWLGGVVGSLAPGATAVETGKRVGLVLGSSLLGLVAFVFIMGAALG